MVLASVTDHVLCKAVVLVSSSSMTHSTLGGALIDVIMAA